ncbi:MAG: Tex-like N-terminal domain-containing protein [Breznakia sp.]
MIDQIAVVAKQLALTHKQVEETLRLLEAGNTVPFIARYRKEMTKGLDEEQIRLIHEVYEYKLNLDKRKEDVLRLITEQGKLSDAITSEIMVCEKLAQVEDIYRPYKQKKKTRASEAIKAGLQPLAEQILTCPKTFDVTIFENYINDFVSSEAEVLQGAKDIIAEKIADDMRVRNKIYESMMQYGKVQTKEKKHHNDEKKVYKMYYNHEERISLIAPHRIMAIDRAEKEKVIQVHITINEEYIKNWVKRRFIKWSSSPTTIYIEEAMEDSLKRLAYPSLERMVRSELSENAHTMSIDVFSLNLEKLLLQPPMKHKVVLGFDPAFRTGCKLAVVNVLGKMENVCVIYPHQPVNKVKEAKQKLLDVIKEYKVDVIAIGNGTASRESERFVANVIQEYHLDVAYTLVSEAGASVYSASKLAIQEYPDLQVEERSAISIARRIQDPLSELIKIDPQSIGVGQYQHDLPLHRLRERLSFVVEKAVNLVGVNVNQASATLLQNVSGLSASSALSIVAYREANGAITTRKEIKKIPKIGPKSYEQSIGFLRIEEGSEPLDKTGIHVESYTLAKQILSALSLGVDDMGSKQANAAVKHVNKQALLEHLDCDHYVLDDILDAICLPLRDYRDRYDAPILRNDIVSFEDLQEGDALEGVVRNVVDFGAFVDIGLKEDGLIHISQMAKTRVKHPSDIVSIGDILEVWVHKIDEEKHKVQLTLRGE